MPTKPSQVGGQLQSRDPAFRRRPVSAGDVTYVLGALLFSGLRAVPAPRRMRLINAASPWLARLLYTLDLHPTRTIRGNLEKVLIPQRPSVAVKADTRRLLAMVVWNALVINTLPALTRKQVMDLLPVDDTACLDSFVDGDRPVLIWSYHFGVSPLIVAALLHVRGYPVHAVTHVRQLPGKGSVLGARYFGQLQAIGDRLSIIDPGEGVQRKLLDVFKNKAYLYVTPDYMIPEDEAQRKSAFEVPIDFLGRRAYVHAGGLRLAKRLEAQVVTVLFTRSGAGNGRLVVEPFVLPTSGLKPDDLQQDLQLCMRRLEAQVLAHPYLWLDLKRKDLVKRLIEPQMD